MHYSQYNLLVICNLLFAQCLHTHDRGSIYVFDLKRQTPVVHTLDIEGVNAKNTFSPQSLSIWKDTRRSKISSMLSVLFQIASDVKLYHC